MYFIRKLLKIIMKNLITVIPFVIFPPLSFSPLLKNFWKKILSVVISPPKFKHKMLKNYVFCYIILIKLNKIFKIIFQKFFVGRCHFPPSQKSVKSSLFGGKMTKGITVFHLILYKKLILKTIRQISIVNYYIQ